MIYNSLRLELTGVCNYQCLYCHASEKNTKLYRKQQLSFGRMLQLISEAKALGVKNFILTGGEPFLNKNWDRIAEYCGQDSRVVISTNGSHFTEENLNKLKKLPQVSEFRTSLDGLETNDIIREGSNYRESIDAIKRIKEYLPDSKIMVQTVLYKQNIAELVPLYEELKKLKISRWRLSQLWKTVRTKNNAHILNFSDYDLMFDIYENIIKRYQLDNFPFRLGIDNVYDSFITKEDYVDMDLNTHPCLYEFDYLCINANGDIIFCPALNKPMANVKSQSIKDAVENSEWFSDFKRITIESLNCKGCRYIKICGGGCRADALRWMGNIRAEDVNSCCMMVRVEKRIVPLLTTEEQKAYNNLIDIKGYYPRVEGDNIEEVINNHERRAKKWH